ncbi:MAG: endonuclease MutS2 [Cyanobacteria bacterium P01_C01_bin.69]
MIQSETLNLLEWPRLCRHLATFTATNIGNIAAQRLPIPTSQAESEVLLAQTVETTQMESTVGGLKFGGIRDIGDALERAQVQGILSGDELLDIATTLSGARRLRRQIDAQEDLPILQALVENLRTFPELEQEIHRCIDDRGNVADRASAKLGGIRQNLKVVRDRIYAKLQRITQRQNGALQETLITQRNDRFVLPVKAPQKDAIPGIVHDVSTSGATLYVEPHSIVDNGNKRRALRKEEEVEAEAIRQMLTYQVAEVLPELEHLMLVMVKLDLATARGRYGLWMDGNAPRFVEHEQITLRQLKHPLLLWQQKKEQSTKVVPTDLVMRPDLRVVAITGPNTGGKTVTLKTLGLTALMAKVGMFIPAKEPVELPWFESVLADIGDEQSIEQSLSTFSGHVKRIGRVLDEIDEEKGEADFANSLVLLDEVGAGTDPSEGSALAIALLKYLADHTRLTVATTHYGELKSLKYEDERFENASVEFDDVKLAPTYKLLWGIPGRSNALSIAQRLGMKESVLESARQRMGGENEDVNQVIEGLEAQRQRQERRAQEAEKLVAKAEKFYKEVESRAQSLRDREQKMKRQQEKDVETALLHARAEVAKVIRDLQKGGLTGKDAQQATEKLNQIEEKRLPTGKHPAKVASTGTGYRPKEGERVRLASLGGQVAEVMEEADGDGKVAVRFGIMKMTVDLSDIESLKGEKAEPIEKKSSRSQGVQPVAKTLPEAPMVKTESNTVDLRGMRVSEAESVIEEAIQSARGPLWLIHGHGTGKLRRGVQEYLKMHPQVKSFEPADQVDGGKGVTIAKI